MAESLRQIVPNSGASGKNQSGEMFEANGSNRWTSGKNQSGEMVEANGSNRRASGEHQSGEMIEANCSNRRASVRKRSRIFNVPSREDQPPQDAG